MRTLWLERWGWLSRPSRSGCALHGIEPWRYLRDLFYLLPDWPKSRVLELAPAYFEQTLQQEEAKRRLAAVGSGKSAD